MSTALPQYQVDSLQPRGSTQSPANKQPHHHPVMLNEAMRLLAPQANGVYVDATFGAGGFSAAMLAAQAHIWAFDRDPDTQSYAEELAKHYPNRLHWIQDCFNTLNEHLAQAGIYNIDGIVFDIGVSSMQLDHAERGFAIRRDGPLDMRMERYGITAADIVNQWNRRDLTRILTQYGEEPNTHRIVDAILTARRQKAITRTSQLAELISSAISCKRRYSRIHPATRTFQALRITVNDELNQLAQGLNAAHNLLCRGGRIVVIAFHSLEDRIVKRTFNNQSASHHWHTLTKHPLRPSDAECQINPRARSARLRAAEKIDSPPCLNK